MAKNSGFSAQAMAAAMAAAVGATGMGVGVQMAIPVGAQAAFAPLPAQRYPPFWGTTPPF